MKVDTPEKHCLVRASCAKDRVFSAQDAADLIANDGTRDRVRRELAAARSHLEAVDRVLRDAIHFPKAGATDARRV